MDISREEWAPIHGYEDYMVSSDGNVVSLNFAGRGKARPLKHEICKGYHGVQLYKDGKRRRFLIHRLVAEAFIPNPKGLCQVNHIDEDKSNNSMQNLEWCEQSYNNSYGTARRRMRETEWKRYGKAIAATNREGAKTTFPSIRWAAKCLNIPRCQISAVLNGKQLSAHGFSFEEVR